LTSKFKKDKLKRWAERFMPDDFVNFTYLGIVDARSKPDKPEVRLGEISMHLNLRCLGELQAPRTPANLNTPGALAQEAQVDDIIVSMYVPGILRFF
jgi:hypothetical protein